MFFTCLLCGIAIKATQRSQSHSMKLLYCSTPETEGFMGATELLSLVSVPTCAWQVGEEDSGDVRSIWEFKVTDNKVYLFAVHTLTTKLFVKISGKL